MRHGLDWCWSSISDCREATRCRGSASPCSLPTTQHGGVCPHPIPQTLPGRAQGRLWALTHHLVVSVLRREVQRDLPVQRGHVDGGGGAEQDPHGLHTALPRRVVQGPHPCGQWGHSAGLDTAPRWPQGAEMVATGAVPGGHPLPLLSLMSTVACASSSSEMRSRLPPRAAWCRAENLRHKVGLSPAPAPLCCPHSHPYTQGHGLRARIVTWLCLP